MSGLIRSVLLTAIAVACILLVAMHGFIRALVLAMAIAVATGLPKTPVWRAGERSLVRLTGSRRRAAVVAMLMLIGVLAVVNIYNFVH